MPCVAGMRARRMICAGLAIGNILFHGNRR
jgi:hypothetical protein